MMTENDDLLIPGDLFKLMKCKECPELDVSHITILSKIYNFMDDEKTCEVSNAYFENYFNKSKTTIKSYLEKLESYGLILRYCEAATSTTLSKRYIWVNTKLVNKLLKKQVLNESFTIPNLALKYAKQNGWKECI